MTHEQILEKALQQALDNGWQPNTVTTGSVADRARYIVRHPQQLYGVIFNHGFARAIWGDDAMTVDKGCAYEALYEVETPISEFWRQHFLNSWNYDMPMWAYHLAKMVLADDPIQYLGDHLEVAA